jgi:predicted DNA-binding transcriptional regulator AlpA
MSTQKPYLTSLEAVEYLSLPSLNALQQRMKRKTIPAWCWTRMGGKSLRFIRAALDEWLQADRAAELKIVGPHAPSSSRKAVAS